MNNKLKLALVTLPFLLVSCGTGKVAVQDNGKGASANAGSDVSQSSGAVSQSSDKASRANSFAIVQKVNDTQVATDNIVADMTFSAVMGSKDVSVPGSLHMRKDQIVRIQLFVPVLHTEVGRLEFTPDYVLVVDRIHKQFVKEDYNKLDFLRANGLNFYSLQALFWNQLFLPGSKSVGEKDLEKFKADSDGKKAAVSLSEGSMTYLWNANATTGLISDALVSYSSTAHGKSSLTWKYSNFKPVGAKMFPAFEEFSFQTTSSKKVQQVTVTLDMDGIETSAKWDTQTTLSSKYKKIEATDIFSKLFKN